MNKLNYKQTKLGSEFERLPLKKLFVISFLTSLATIVISLILRVFLPPEIPLFYGLPQTIEQVAPSILIVLPALCSMFITVLNAVFSIIVDSTYLKKTLAFASISVSILSIIATFKIIFLVGSL